MHLTDVTPHVAPGGEVDMLLAFLVAFAALDQLLLLASGFG